MHNQVAYTNEFLDMKRRSGDPHVDNFIAYAFKDTAKKQYLQHWMNSTSGKDSFLLLKQTFPDYDLVNAAGQLPSWAQPHLMKAGTAFFSRHSTTIMSLLGLLSLPYCYTAANGAMVLYLSELIRKQTTKRLFDTAVFVWEVMGPDAFAPGGTAFEDIFKVRVMHAVARYYTLQSGKWNDCWGVPINQEDMAGTNLSFSLIIIRGLRKLGFTISHEEQAAFMHLWAVIGFLTGLDEDLIPENVRKAQQLDTLIKHRHFKISEHGRELTSSLTAHILSVNKSKATSNDILGLMRYLLGKEIADMLAIDAPELPLYKITLIRTINLFKGFKPEGNSKRSYCNAYDAFKMQHPELSKRS